MRVIRSPKNNRRRQKPQRKTRAGSRAPGKTMPVFLAWPDDRPALAPGPCVCNRSYIATPAAWRVDTAPLFILKVFAPADLKHIGSVLTRRCGKRQPVVVVSDPRAARGRVIVDLIPRADRCTRARARALIFCKHCFYHCAAFSFNHISQFSVSI